ncbi:PspC domain-containing protein [Gordonia alkanivorans]|uniref:PspC domain-containing protein n=1 Tax=Gordonia alkanivorans TaxID=84096 RepID=UPI0024477611|nr:PspC domain-containing protein [Gordonia alkanivorans]MDH3049203.1 PspC domain-containing protein [Gordonia alkanivorans]
MIAMDTKEFQNQLREMWSTRPYRPENRTIAGVCSGIAARYRVDPTLVKIAFVVSAFFGGSGLILYLAAWIAFPGRQRAHAEALRAAHSGGRGGPRGHGWGNPQFIVLAVLAIVIVTSVGPNRTWGSGGLVGAILMLGGWYLLHLRTPTPPPGTSIDTVAVTDVVVPPPTAGQFERWVPRAMAGTGTTGVPANTPTPTNTPGVDLQKPTHGPGTQPSPATNVTPTTEPAVNFAATEEKGLSQNDVDTASAGTQRWSPLPTPVPASDDIDTAPPAWDPLGVAPFAWDLPEPATPVKPIEQRRRRSPLTLIVLGLAVIVGAIGTALHQAGVDWFTVPRILSLSLAVVGAGLVLAATLRRRTGEHSTGLLPVAILLGIATIVTTTVSGVTLPTGGVGDRNWKPLSENDIQTEYTLGMGEMTLDLREIDLTADRRVELRNGMGVIEVALPENMNVRVTCDTGVGDIECPAGLDGGRDGTDGPVLEIDAHTGMGEVRVTR